MTTAALPRTLVLACGALVNELQAVIAANRLNHLDIECLPAKWHMTPARITPEIIKRVRRAKADYDRLYIGYADCGTQGDLDAFLAAEGIDRLPGAHCYEFFAGADRFAALQDAEPGTFYLTDYLVKHFDRVVWAGLGIEQHPELQELYFGNYTRLIYLAQLTDPALTDQAEAIADRLGLRFELIDAGYGEFEDGIVAASLVALRPRTMNSENTR